MATTRSVGDDLDDGSSEANDGGVNSMVIDDSDDGCGGADAMTAGRVAVTGDGCGVIGEQPATMARSSRSLAVMFPLLIFDAERPVVNLRFEFMHLLQPFVVPQRLERQIFR